MSTTKTRVELPYAYIPEFDRGRALANGQLFFGVVDQDPELSPVAVFVLMENGDEIAIPQPVLTSPGGVPIYNGSPAILLVDGHYSMRVRDSLGAEIYYAADAAAGGGNEGGGFIPLAGTEADAPVTGKIVYDTLRNGASWSETQGLLFGVNSMVFTGDGVSSGFYINVKNSLGNALGFQFDPEGLFQIPCPTVGLTEDWVFQSNDWLGAGNALLIYSQDRTTGLQTNNPIVLGTTPDEIFTFGENGKVIQTGVVVGGDDNQVLVTKLYVDDVVAGIGGLPSDSPGQMLVGTGAGWLPGAWISLDETTDPTRAGMSIRGQITLINETTPTGDWHTLSADLLGLNTLGWVPSTTEGTFVIYTNSATTESISFTSGFASAPKAPTAPEHLTNKQYVDAKLPASGTLDDTLRFDGTNYIPTSTLQVSASGDVLATQGFTVGGIATFNSDLTVNADMSVVGSLFSLSLQTTVGSVASASQVHAAASAPTAADHCTRMDYVDAQVAGKVDSSELTGIAVAGGSIVSDGSGAQSVANCFGVSACTISGGTRFLVTLSSAVTSANQIITCSPEGAVVQVAASWKKISDTQFEIYIVDANSNTQVAGVGFSFTVHDKGR
jgi:hypothetical protein